LTLLLPSPTSRSPADRPKRRRSPSPTYPAHRARHRSPSPARLPDPASLEYQLPFRQFAEWFRASHPQTAKADDDELRRLKAAVEVGTVDPSAAKERVGMSRRYERYRKEFSSRQLYSLYLSHRDSAWFRERYGVGQEEVELRKRTNRAGRVPAVEEYVEGLRGGKWDAVSYDDGEFRVAVFCEDRWGGRG
jgi:hypothetical protein